MTASRGRSSSGIRDFRDRARRIVIAALLSIAATMVDLSAVARIGEDSALAQIGVVTTATALVSVVGAGHGVRLLRRYAQRINAGGRSAQGGDAGVTTDAVLEGVSGVRAACALMLLAWLMCLPVLSAIAADPRMFVLLWLSLCLTFVCAPALGYVGSVMQVAGLEFFFVRNAAITFVVECAWIGAVVWARPLDMTGNVVLLSLANQVMPFGIAVLNLRRLKRVLSGTHRGLVSAFLPAVTWRHVATELPEVRRASFSAWDGLSAMIYFFVLLAMLSRWDPGAAAVLGFFVSINRSMILPLKQVGLIGGRLAAKHGDAVNAVISQRQVVRRGLTVIAVAEFVVALLWVPHRGYSGSQALGVGAVFAAQMLLEPYASFGVGQGKVLVGTSFMVRTHIVAICLCALPASLIIAVRGPEVWDPALIVAPFVAARGVIAMEVSRAFSGAASNNSP